jgi:hypothetical protein
MRIHLSVRILDSGDVRVSKGAMDEPEHQAGFADAACAEDNNPVIVALLGHCNTDTRLLTENKKTVKMDTILNERCVLLSCTFLSKNKDKPFLITQMKYHVDYSNCLVIRQISNRILNPSLSSTLV